MKTRTVRSYFFRRISSFVFLLVLVFGGVLTTSEGVFASVDDAGCVSTYNGRCALSPAIAASKLNVGIEQVKVQEDCGTSGKCYSTSEKMATVGGNISTNDACHAAGYTCLIEVETVPAGYTQKGMCSPGFGICAEKTVVPTGTANPSGGTPTGTANPATVPTGTANPAGTLTDASTPQSTSFTNPLQYNTVQEVLNSLLETLRGIIVILSIIFIIIGAVMYITSGGNSKQIESAKSAITAAMIGLAIGIAAPSFLKEISTILGWNSTPADVSGAISLTQILTNVLTFLTGIVGILSIIMLIIGALMILSSAGDEDRIDSGKKIVKYSVIGIIVAFAALVIVKQIAALFV